MKIEDLKANPMNPRTISNEKSAALKKAMDKFGDLGGIIFNIKSKQLVGGHQRTSLLKNAIIEITTKYDKPTKTGTVAEGYIETNKGDRFSYREVSWDENIERAANLAANKNAGDWDPIALNKLLKDIAPADLSLTMFGKMELSAIPGLTVVSEHTRKKTDGHETKEKNAEPAECKLGQIYMLGKIEFKVGEDPHYCDLIISRWEKYSEKKAKLISKPIVRKKTASKK